MSPSQVTVLHDVQYRVSYCNRPYIYYEEVIPKIGIWEESVPHKSIYVNHIHGLVAAGEPHPDYKYGS